MYDDAPASPSGNLGAVAAKTPRHRPRIALAGPLSAGKEAMLRLMTDDCVPLFDVWRPGLPPVLFCHGDPRADWIDTRGTINPLPGNDLSATPPQAALVRLWCLAETLRDCDLVTSAEAMDRRIAGLADVVLWCDSNADAAAERIAACLPDRLLAKTTLVLTRRGADAAPRLAAARGFAAVLSVAPDAARQSRALADDDAAHELWEESGGASLFRALAIGPQPGSDDGHAPPFQAPDSTAVTPTPAASSSPCAVADIQPREPRDTSPMTDDSIKPASPAPEEDGSQRRTPRPSADDAANRMALLRAEIAALSEGDAARAAPQASAPAPRPAEERRPVKSVSLFRRAANG